MKNKDELKKNTDDIHFAALHENDEHESEDTVDAAEFYEDSDVYEDDDAYEDDQYHSYSAESREKAERSRKKRAWKVQAEKIVIGILIVSAQESSMSQAACTLTAISASIQQSVEEMCPAKARNRSAQSFLPPLLPMSLPFTGEAM